MGAMGEGRKGRIAAIAGAMGLVVTILLAIPGAIDSMLSILGRPHASASATSRPPATPTPTPSVPTPTTVAAVVPGPTTIRAAPTTAKTQPTAAAPAATSVSGPPYPGTGNGPYPLAPPGYPVSLVLNPSSVSHTNWSYVTATLPGLPNGEIFRIELMPPTGTGGGFCSTETSRCGLNEEQSSTPYPSADTAMGVGPNDPTGVWHVYVDLVNREVTLSGTFVVFS